MTARAAAALALVLLAGCFSRFAAPGPDEVAWTAVRKPHTRRLNLYDELSAAAFGSATWESPALRAARVARVASWRAASPAEVEALRAAEEADAERYDDFTLSFFTPDRTTNDLDASGTTWRMALVQPGAPDRLPVEVRSLRVDPELRTLHPDIGDFDVVYRIRFARAGTLATPFTLRVAGPRGRMDFAFDGQGRAVAH